MLLFAVRNKTNDLLFSEEYNGLQQINVRNMSLYCMVNNECMKTFCFHGIISLHWISE